MKKLPDQLWLLHYTQADEFRAAVDLHCNGKKGRSIRDLSNYWGMSTTKARMILKKYTKEQEKQEVGQKKNTTKKIKIAARVLLTREECEYLMSEFGKQGARRIVDILDAYKQSTGKQYKSDMGAIRAWVISRYRKEEKEGDLNEKNAREFFSSFGTDGDSEENHNHGTPELKLYREV